MALPASGPLSMSQINTEFGRGNNLNSYRGTTYYTSSAGPFTFSSGAISFNNFYGTQVNAPSFSFSITSNQDRANLRSLAVAAGWNGTSAVVATLNAGVYIYSTVVGTAGLTINGSWPGGVTLINNGFIMGMGGTGGGTIYNGSTYTQNYLQSAGSDAINLGVSCTIQNNSYIGGGGGGGGSNVGAFAVGGYGGGGGAGGGAGATFNNNGTVQAGPVGGGPGSSGTDGAAIVNSGSGGRIMPGTDIVTTVSGGTPPSSATSIGGGANNAGSASGVNGGTTGGTSVTTPGKGGTAGGSGSVTAGYSYGALIIAGGGGGGYGASGGASFTAGNAGAAGGKCANLNGFTITWSATGNRYGAIS
jgi:hypothetical protein